MQKILPKKELPKFINNLIKKHQVIAPTKNKTTSFQKISDFKEIYLEKLTQIPAKQHFQPENETLLEFKNNKAIENKGEIKKTILFGLRKCDLNAIQILDKVMYDPQYLAKRKNTILIGLFCENPDKFCFCNSMELVDYHDLFLFPKGKNYIIDVGTPKGKTLVKNLKTLEKEIKIEYENDEKKPLQNILVAILSLLLGIVSILIISDQMGYVDLYLNEIFQSLFFK